MLILTVRVSRFARSLIGVLAQLVERLNGIEEVRGSNPLGSTFKLKTKRYEVEKNACSLFPNSQCRANSFKCDKTRLATLMMRNYPAQSRL